ncbi:MAG TPA: Rieske 2Fe-2S domain-containing protein [Nitrososphaeraceae archaeon]|nr:Rieske 2Fe-2S domain-containing protein [Nitrososphaeraceae archaeon]
MSLNKDNYYKYVGLSSEIPKGKSKSISIKDAKSKKNINIAIFNVSGRFYAISDSCAHKDGPLSKGFLNNDIITCPWHGWKYSVKDGKSPHEGGDSVNSYKVKIVKDKLYVNPFPSKIGKRTYKPYTAYSELENSVNNYLIQKSTTTITTTSSHELLNGKNNPKIRILGISTTNSNDKVAPRKSTSETALEFALDFSKKELNTETIMIKLRELEFKDCEGYYSKNAKACIFPCSISEIDKEDQMIQIYEKVILWADVVLIATPIRWGNSSSLYYKMIQRMNCVQNQIITNNKFLIRDKVAAFIITGGQDNIQHVAGELLAFWSQLGFVFGKFPFVGWTRGWYSEDTENNYEEMTARTNINGNQDSISKAKKSISSIFYQDIIKTIVNAVEMSQLVKRYQYDENLINTFNQIVNADRYDDSK